jgi:hypothetical protein
MWATVADILTFYQERIANEGFLRTARLRDSILRMARLLDYQLRPGVAATTLLAFTLDRGATVHIPVGLRVQSVPADDEQPQIYETLESIAATAALNRLRIVPAPEGSSAGAHHVGHPGARTGGLAPHPPGPRRPHPTLRTGQRPAGADRPRAAGRGPRAPGGRPIQAATWDATSSYRRRPGVPHLRLQRADPVHGRRRSRRSRPATSSDPADVHEERTYPGRRRAGAEDKYGDRRRAAGRPA